MTSSTEITWKCPVAQLSTICIWSPSEARVPPLTLKSDTKAQITCKDDRRVVVDRVCVVITFSGEYMGIVYTDFPHILDDGLLDTCEVAVRIRIHQHTTVTHDLAITWDQIFYGKDISGTWETTKINNVGSTKSTLCMDAKARGKPCQLKKSKRGCKIRSMPADTYLSPQRAWFWDGKPVINEAWMESRLEACLQKDIADMNDDDILKLLAELFLKSETLPLSDVAYYPYMYDILAVTNTDEAWICAYFLIMSFYFGSWDTRGQTADLQRRIKSFGLPYGALFPFGVGVVFVPLYRILCEDGKREPIRCVSQHAVTTRPAFIFGNAHEYYGGATAHIIAQAFKIENGKVVEEARTNSEINDEWLEKQYAPLEPLLSYDTLFTN